MNPGSTPIVDSHWPQYDEEQIAAAVKVLRSGKTNYWSGSECRRFEDEFAEYTGVPHAITLANGTVALELALIALGVGPGDEVVVPSSSFVATASCVVARGGVPVFADIDARTLTLTDATVQPVLSDRTRAIIAVHLYGRPCPMGPIMSLARQHDLFVIEDCAQGHGARYHGRPVGSFGDVAAFSFCQDKIISTGGEGGMLLCQSKPVWARAWSYKDHGKHPSSLAAEPGTGYRWSHQGPGTNWRMTEFQAAIGRVQLQRLDAWVTRRRQIAAMFRQRLESLSVLRLPELPLDIGHSWYRFPMSLHTDHLCPGWTRDRVVSELCDRGVACGTGVCPELYLEQSLERFAPEQRLPNASDLATTGLCLTMHHMMADTEVARIADAVCSVLSGSCY